MRTKGTIWETMKRYKELKPFIHLGMIKAKAEAIAQECDRNSHIGMLANAIIDLCDECSPDV